MVYFCNICNSEEDDDSHRASQIHRFNYALENYHRNRYALRGNRHGIELTVEVVPLNGFEYNFTVQPDKKGRYFLNISPEKFRSHKNEIEFKCKIKNGRKKNDDPIVITYAGVLHPYEPFSMIDPKNNLDKGQFVPLELGKTYEVKVKLTLTENTVSNFKIPIYFTIQTFTKKKEMESFSIARSIIVQIHNDSQEEEIVPEKSPFTNNKWDKVIVIPPTKNFRTNSDQFPIPNGFFKTLMFGLKKDFGDGVLKKILDKLHPGCLTMNNYNHYFHILLWLEEVCSIIGLSCYNMENVKLKYRSGDILVLEVPGLAEKRPSVVKGDLIEIKIHGDHTSYQGVIQKVNDKTVDIHFLNYFILEAVQYQPDLEIDVRFVLGRIHFERMHQGVEQVVANEFQKNLFPYEKPNRKVYQPITISQNELFNKSIYSNQEQMTAVLKIVNNTSNGAPYLVYGPPGTGKTVTIVEAIYHLKRLTKYKILVCAPANAACNMLTEKLAAFCDKKELKRIMSENCDTETIHDSIVDNCNIYYDGDEKVVVPFPKSDLNKYRVLVTTLVLAGKYTREYHPDIVFIDEAAQAREPEACCAIGLLMKNKQLILAGDPKQLGPVVHSEICKDYNYDTSLLERLMDLPVYQNDKDHNYITMLKLNFRSHTDVLRLPNKMFYDNQLKAVSASALSDPLAKIFVYKLIVGSDKKNVHKGAAVEFCSVLAQERREGRSPSYYNPREATMVSKYIQALTSIKFENPAHKVTPDQIGVVTPYIRQRCKIREALRNTDYHDVEVGTTEAFQGREKRVMIISTVRAQEDLLLYDKLYKLGFVREPKRFNVAITRAKSKVIVIGNPLVLSTDIKWKEFIEQAKESGTFCGAPYQERTQRVRDDISNRLNKVKLKDVLFKHGPGEH